MYILVPFFRIEYIFFSSKGIARHLQVLRYSLDLLLCVYILNIEAGSKNSLNYGDDWTIILRGFVHN